MRQPDRTHPEAGFVELEPLAIVGIDLVWVIVGLLAFMILVGFWLVATILNDLFGAFSIFGFHPFGFVQGLLSGIMRKEAAFLDQKAKGLGHLLWSIVMVIWRFAYVATATMVGLWTQLLNTADAFFANLLHETNRSTAAEEALRAKEQADIARLQTEINDNLGAAETYAELRIQNVQAQINALENQVANLPSGTDPALRAELQADVAALNARINTVGTDLANQLAAEQADLTNQLAQMRTVLEQEITNGVNTAEQYATGLLSGVGLGSILQTLQALQSRLSKVETETAECLDPLCDTVTPQAPRLGRLGQNLGNLELLGIEALMIALAAECFSNPATVARDVSAVTHEVGDVVMTGFRDLIGA